MSDLNGEEKEALANVIEIIYGYDSELLGMKDRYTEQTIDAVENAFEAASRCNDSMKELVSSLVGGAKLMSKGWLKRVLHQMEEKLLSDKVKFDGLACRVTAARNWKTEIIMSTYGL